MSERANSAAVSTAPTTKDLKRVLGRKELMSLAIGQIIGAGIMALMGAAIGMTERSVFYAFLLSTVFVVIDSLGSILIGGTVRLRGGDYTKMAALVGKRTAGAYVICDFIWNIGIAILPLSFADYLQSLIPGIPIKATALVVLTLFFVINIFGVKQAALIETIMLVVMGLALGSFVVFGMPQVQPGAFGGVSNYLLNGPVGIISAAAFLTYATSGSFVVISYSGECKHPTKDIPFVLIASTLVVAGIYAVISIVAAGVLPIEQVADQSLALVAKKILPEPLFIFFIVGGCLFSLATTLNATFSWITKSLLQASVDGWFPKKFGTLNKHGAPIYILTMYYLLGVVPIVFGFDIEFVADFALILSYAFNFAFSYAIIRLPKVFPEQWKRSSYHCSNSMLWVCAALTVGMSVLNICMLGSDLNPVMIIGNIASLAFAYIYAFLREKHVDMEVSYEDD